MSCPSSTGTFTAKLTALFLVWQNLVGTRDCHVVVSSDSLSGIRVLNSGGSDLQVHLVVYRIKHVLFDLAVD